MEYGVKEIIKLGQIFDGKKVISFVEKQKNCTRKQSYYTIQVVALFLFVKKYGKIYRRKFGKMEVV